MNTHEFAQQPNATSFNPNNLPMREVAVYTRLIRAPLVRVWENVLDWEHLPYLHDTSFNFVELDVAGSWGWRTWSDPDHLDHVELTLANESQYVARSYQRGRQISEIWTTLTAEEENTRIHVAFHLPDVTEADADKLGQLMLNLYTRLWDEDEAMMQQRHFRLHERRSEATTRHLGHLSDLKSRLADGEMITFQLAKREFQLREQNGQLICHTTICPHLLGPLNDIDLTSDRLRCPWHGYEFDLATGECVSPTAATCRLPTPPSLSIEAGEVIARSNAT